MSSVGPFCGCDANAWHRQGAKSASNPGIAPADSIPIHPMKNRLQGQTMKRHQLAQSQTRPGPSEMQKCNSALCRCSRITLWYNGVTLCGARSMVCEHVDWNFGPPKQHTEEILRCFVYLIQAVLANVLTLSKLEFLVSQFHKVSLVCLRPRQWCSHWLGPGMDASGSRWSLKSLRLLPAHRLLHVWYLIITCLFLMLFAMSSGPKNWNLASLPPSALTLLTSDFQVKDGQGTNLLPFSKRCMVAYVQLSSWDATVKFWPLFDRYTWQKIHK